MSYYAWIIAEFLGRSKIKLNQITEFLVQFGFTSPVDICDSPHVVRLLPRDLSHEKKSGLDTSGDVGMVWFQSLGRSRDGMMVNPREKSYYGWGISEILGRRQTKPYQIPEIWFSLVLLLPSISEIPREMSYYVRTIAEILGRSKIKPNHIWVDFWFSLIDFSRVFLRFSAHSTTSPEVMKKYGLDPSGDVVLRMDNRRIPREK